MENLNVIIGKINSLLYFPILVVLLIAVGLYFTIRTGFIQVSLLKEAFKAVSYTHLTLPTIAAECRSRWSPYH